MDYRGREIIEEKFDFDRFFKGLYNGAYIHDNRYVLDKLEQ